MFYGVVCTLHFWRDCPFVADLSVIKGRDFLVRLLWVLASSDYGFVERFEVASWLIWSNRNVLLHGGRVQSGECLWEKAGVFVRDFQASSVCAGMRAVVRDSCGVPRVTASWFVKGDFGVDH
ncbi:hypothetical protein ACOSP7_015051 [Xanthoceras sorbifolium]